MSSPKGAREALGDEGAWPPDLSAVASIVRSSNQPMFVVWGPGRTLFYNAAYARILGRKHPDAWGRDFMDVWSEIRADLEPIVSAAYRGEPVQMDDISLAVERHGYTEEAHFAFSYSPLSDDAGRISGFFCACTETTAQVLAERRLAASEARHRSVLANMDEAFTLVDADFNILEVNAHACELTQLSRDEMVGHNHWTRFPGTRDSALGKLYRHALASGTPQTLEHEYRFPDGRSAWFEVRAYPVPDGLALFFREVTGRRQIQADAALAAERVQLALDAGAIVGTWVWSVPDDRFVADERFAASFDLDAAQCKEGLALDVVAASIHLEDWPRVQVAISEVLARGGPYRCEYRVRQRGGAYRWVEANGRVELDGQGRPVRFPGVLLDIELRRRAERERDQATAMFAAFIEAVPGVVYGKDLSGRLTIGNRGTAELLGLPPESFIGRTDEELLADPEQAAAVMATDRRIMENAVPEQVEEWVYLPDGTPKLWLSTKAPFFDASGKVAGLIGSSTDITDRKRVEEQLRLSEQRAALAMEVAQLGMWTLDIASGVVTPDARCRDMWGVPVDTLDRAAFLAHVHAEDIDPVEASLQSVLSGATLEFSEEYRWIRPDTRKVVWLISRGRRVAEPDPSGNPRSIVIGSVSDVTERRHLLDSLQLADRRKDEFLAMLAHELRNPLAPITNAAHVLNAAPRDERNVLAAAAIIGRQVRHLTELVDDLLDVSRVTRGLVRLDTEALDLNAVVSAAIEQAQPILQSRMHTLVVTQRDGAVPVTGDRSRLIQVFSNLFNNAAKYTPQGGTITVSIEADEDIAKVEVADTGIGIEASLLPHVFELFSQAERTPDRSQGGLGIGLALVRTIVRLHDGEIAARSEGTNRGSTFAVTLPLARHAPASVAEQAQPAPPTSVASLDVLVVDDNRDAAETLSAVLRMSGHHVATAFTGGDGLALLASRERWDAIILDIGLPDMTGFELATRMRALDPAASAVLIALTGYGQPHDRVLSRAAGFHHHLVKPADIERINELLRLGRPAG